MTLKYKSKNEKMQGFTLVESIIATVFVLIAFVASYSLFAKTIRSDIESRYEAVASGLVQECVETIRNRRDNFVLNNPTFSISNWLNNDSNCGFGNLTFNGVTVSGSCSGTNQKIVTCTASWNSRLTGETRNVVVKGLLTDWQQQ